MFTSDPAQAEEANSDLNLTIATVLSLSISSPCETTTNSPNLTLDITPTQSGIITTCPHIIRVDSNTPGYQLLFKADSANLTHTSIPGETVTSTSSGTTPSQLTLNSWGFAIPATADTNNTNVDKLTLSSYGSFDYGSFDPTYSQRTNSSYATTTDKYATTPTTETELKHLTTGNHNENTVVSNDQTTIYYGAAIDFNTMAGKYKTTITYTAIGETIPCQWDPAISFESPNCKEPAYMQDFTTADCQALGGNTPPNTTTDYTPYTTTLTDKRDGTEYRIRKLADGKCWMIDNLKLELKNGMTLTDQDTNLESGTQVTVSLATGGRIDNNSFTTSGHLTTSNSSSSGINYDGYNAWRQVDPSNTNTTTSGSFNCDPEGTKINCGYLYNFYTATASTAPNTKITGKADYSICPAGWKLPSGKDADGDYGYLDTKYGGSGTGHYIDNPDTRDLWLSAGAWQSAFSGRYYSDLYDQGSLGLSWSSSVSSANLAYSTNIGSSYVYPGTNNNNRSFGFTVRCLVG